MMQQTEGDSQYLFGIHELDLACTVVLLAEFWFHSSKDCIMLKIMLEAISFQASSYFVSHNEPALCGVSKTSQTVWTAFYSFTTYFMYTSLYGRTPSRGA
jgi:hypothetical protein